MGTDGIGLAVDIVQQGGIIGEKFFLGSNLDYPIDANGVGLECGMD